MSSLTSDQRQLRHRHLIGLNSTSSLQAILVKRRIEVDYNRNINPAATAEVLRPMSFDLPWRTCPGWSAWSDVGHQYLPFCARDTAVQPHNKWTPHLQIPAQRTCLRASKGPVPRLQLKFHFQGRDSNVLRLL